MPATVGFLDSSDKRSTAEDRRSFQDSAASVSTSRIRGRTSLNARTAFLARSRSGIYVVVDDEDARAEGEGDARCATAVARERRSAPTRSAFRTSDLSSIPWVVTRHSVARSPKQEQICEPSGPLLHYTSSLFCTTSVLARLCNAFLSSNTAAATRANTHLNSVAGSCRLRPAGLRLICEPSGHFFPESSIIF